MKSQPLNCSMNEKCGENRKICPKIEHTLRILYAFGNLDSFQSSNEKSFKRADENI